MKPCTHSLRLLAASWILLLAAQLQVLAQGSSLATFTYQGRLETGDGPANGPHDFQFALFPASTGTNNPVDTTITAASVPVSNGLFTVELSFPLANASFNGSDRWLEIAVRPSLVGSNYVTLTRRQKITATPYAITAGNVISGGLAAGTYGNAVTLNNEANQVSGAFSGNGANVTNVNALTLGGIGSNGFWQTYGNAGAAGAFLGTTDNQPVEFRANGSRVLRLVADLTSPNIIAGSPANDISGGIGASVLGGGNASYPNRALNNYATVVGGISNTASGNASVVMGQFSTAGGYASVASGYGTTAGGFSSFAAGNSARAAHDGSFVWGDNTFADFPSTTNNQFLIRAAGGVGINTNNPNGAALAVNGDMTVTGNFKSGYAGNTINSGVVGAFIGGGGASEGRINRVSADYGAVLGGVGNKASGSGSTAMGAFTTASSVASVAMGNATLASGNYSTAMGIGTTASEHSSTAMGNSTTASGTASTAMGSGTIASGGSATAMGQSSKATGYASTAMGGGTTASALSSTAMGNGSVASGVFSTAMGINAEATNSGSFVFAGATSGTFCSTADYQFSIRAQGGVRLSDDTPAISFGSTTRQMLNLWSTNYGIGVQSASLYFRCDTNGLGGFIWYKGGVHNDGYADAGGGVELMHLVQGALYVNGTLASTSDRNAKENFTPVNPADVLEKVVSLPITRWNYKNDSATPHLGPVAQDFYAAFGVGPDDKHIATVDADGVALAAIQGLNEKLEVRSEKLEGRTQESEDRILKLEAENADLKQELANLKRVVEALGQTRKAN